MATELDHGELNTPLQSRYGRGGIDAALDRYKAGQAKAARAEQRAAAERRKTEREAEKAREKFTAADLAGASHVRDRYGWHRVVRVSVKSVTVETGYSWTYRLPLDRVLQYAVDGKAQ